MEILEVLNPADGTVIDTITMNTPEELNQAVVNAQIAFESWKNFTLRERSQVFYNYRNLLLENIDELTALIEKENGKTTEEAKAEILKAIEVTEFACSLPQICTDKMSEVSKGIHCRIGKKPLGVVASITPFNFPSMVPHWTIPIALCLGNCMILKPSEVVPLSSFRIAELLTQAGLPENVFQVVFGKKEMVEAICDHPNIKAISFVGSTKVAKIVYQRASSNLKRVLCMGGAKNHLLVLPDANEEMTANNVIVSMAGCAGQRCMAASAMVGIGKIDHIVSRLVLEAKKFIPGQNLGAVISKEAKERIENYITEAEQQGATILLDGRNTVVAGKENGFYVGPTIIDNVSPNMRIAKDEVFGPVLVIIRAENVDQGIQIQNESNYGNGASVFTSSGKWSAYVAEKLKAGMVGVNIGIPVPREPFSFGGWDDSRFGVGDVTGESSVNFWTQEQKLTVKWNPEDKKDWMS